MNNQPDESPAQVTDDGGQAPAAARPAVRAEEPADYSKPVAYDTQGRPLYLRPDLNPGENSAPAEHSSGKQQTEDGWSPAFNPLSHGSHQYVHVSRPISPADPPIPPEIMERHELSRKRFPHLNLSKGEFVVSAVKRHPIGLLQIWGVGIVLIGALAAVLSSFLGSGALNERTVSLAAVGLGVMAVLVFGACLVAGYVYGSNRFYLTNESVIQDIQIGLLNKHEQTVSLANIEDASYYQRGILPYMFNYGTIRLSTEGDETTYRFSYVSNPKRQIAILNNVVEAFKNGRPVLPYEDQPS